MRSINQRRGDRKIIQITKFTGKFNKCISIPSENLKHPNLTEILSNSPIHIIKELINKHEKKPSYSHINLQNIEKHIY